ncbi:hypothetical protein QBC46DRAFT_14842 [Diplogelasinospora grovesii]|uniref:Uncharacterized protein n=1 Tax=Diplogelasinospora grovesii TaxID=303347 RepID=A0AAN6NDY3_9PEZI|nr:hypothetical protein QBC46DRAFT_14842 [Diplogelasinospora grovesii]
MNSTRISLSRIAGLEFLDEYEYISLYPTLASSDLISSPFNRTQRPTNRNGAPRAMDTPLARAGRLLRALKILPLRVHLNPGPADSVSRRGNPLPSPAEDEFELLSYGPILHLGGLSPHQSRRGATPTTGAIADGIIVESGLRLRHVADRSSAGDIYIGSCSRPASPTLSTHSTTSTGTASSRPISSSSSSSSSSDDGNDVLRRRGDPRSTRQRTESEIVWRQYWD